MKKRILIFTLILVFLATPVIALASDISGAKWYGLVTISNNDTLATNVATTGDISTENFIAGGFLNASVNNTVVRNSSGADVKFQPGYTDANLWCFWVPIINQNSYLTYILYTANSSGGEFRYFPGAGGMVTLDHQTLELGDNWTIEQKGWVDTSYSVNKNLVHKPQAIRIYISATGNITAIIGEEEVFYSSTSDGELYKGGVDYPTVQTAAVGAATADAHFENVGQAWVDPNYHIYRDGFFFDTSSIPDAATVFAATLSLYGYSDGADTDFDVTTINGTDLNDPLVNADYGDILDDTVSWGSLNTAAWITTGYNNIELNAIGRANINKAGVTKLALRSSRDISATQPTGNEYVGIWMTEEEGTDKDPMLTVMYSWGAVTASGIESGEYTVTTTANVTHLHIEVDGVTDLSPLTANMTNNNEDWTFVENDSMLYLEYQEITINGTQVQYIEWEYDAVFHDLSAFSNNATPSFRGVSSDLDVTANMTAFLAIAEARAPDYVLGKAPPFITSTPNITGNFTTVPPVEGFPLAGVIAAVAGATGTPAQLPLLIIAVFVILAASLSMSATMRKYGSGTLIVKVIVITALCGIFIALKNFGIDFWMLVVFLVIATSLMMASRQIGWQ